MAIVFLLLISILFSFMSYKIGAPKGYGGLGLVLGFLFPLLGLLLVALLPPAAHVQPGARREADRPRYD